MNGTTLNPLDGFIATSVHNTENRAWIFAVTRLRALCEGIRTRFTCFVDWHESSRSAQT
jgi:hypothetical protein